MSIKHEDLRLRDREPRIHPSARLKETRLGRATDIAERVVLRDVTVGDYSYFERGGEAVHADIGKQIENVGRIAQRRPVELQVLARREMAVALVESVGDQRELPQLAR